MRADVGTIQQTLTPDAATVLNQSIAEAARRNHGQTTPLHVAATLLASPSGYLRQACIKSHPNSSHPLQCRALELCFSVALERLPTAATEKSASPEPPLSNALMAALKRAQAHQRRGCPEQQQQPLLAVKVELEQLIISILDDPSVSRVMREASFSSPAVKSAIEQSLGNSNSSVSSPGPVNPGPIGFGYRPIHGPISRNLYLNPRLQQPGVKQTGLPRSTDEVKRVVDIMVRTRKRNPVLVGESEPQILEKEIMGRIENGDITVGSLRNSQVIRVEKELSFENAQMATRVKEISRLVETRMGNSDLGCVVLDLGDLKWLVEQQPAAIGGGEAVAEMGKLLERYRGRLWFIGTATCETYLRCQVYYPSMENDWDLQAIPIAAKSPPVGMFPRLGSNNAMLLNTPTVIDSVSPARSFQIPTVMLQPRRADKNLDSVGIMRCCPQCLQNYKTDVAKLESERSPESGGRTLLPPWLQNAKSGDNKSDSNDGNKNLTKDQELLDLQKKWNESCLGLHPNYHRQSNITASESIPPPSVSLLKLQSSKNPNDNTLQLNSCSDRSPPRSPVATDLVLGRPEKSRESVGLDSDKPGDAFDIESFKKLLKGLTETVWWQHDAASAIAGTITQFKHGNRNPRGVCVSSKGDIWLLLTGPDRVGKIKMASVLSNLVSGTNPITISVGSRRDDERSGQTFRGKTASDRVTKAVRKNPFAVIVIEDIDQADSILRNNIKQAMERGRIADSHGREVSLGNVIIILTINLSPENNDGLSESVDPIDETKLKSLVNKGWQLKFSVRNKTQKRKPSWLYNDEYETPTRQRKEISFDLNESAEVYEDKPNVSSTNSSDVTVDHDQEDNSGRVHKLSLTNPQSVMILYRELGALADDTIFFRPVDFRLIKRKTADSLKKYLSSVLGDGSKLEIDDIALERIAGAIWLSKISLEEWIEETMRPSLNQLKSRVLNVLDDDDVVVKLELDDKLIDEVSGGYLPRCIRTLVD